MNSPQYNLEKSLNLSIRRNMKGESPFSPLNYTPSYYKDDMSQYSRKKVMSNLLYSSQGNYSPIQNKYQQVSNNYQQVPNNYQQVPNNYQQGPVNPYYGNVNQNRNIQGNENINSSYSGNRSISNPYSREIEGKIQQQNTPNR